MVHSFGEEVVHPKEEAMSELLKVKQRWVLRLSEAEAQTLHEAVRHHPHPDARERGAALLSIADGHSPHWVAQHALLRERDPDSIYQWMRFYDSQGLAGLLHRRHGGAHRRRL
jgi:hypothetical protein